MSTFKICNVGGLMKNDLIFKAEIALMGDFQFKSDAPLWKYLPGITMRVGVFTHRTLQVLFAHQQLYKYSV